MRCPICGMKGLNLWAGMTAPPFDDIRIKIVDGCQCNNRDCERKYNWPWFVLNPNGDIYRWDGNWLLYQSQPKIKDPKKIGGFRVIQT